jgi:hypothetical protein
MVINNSTETSHLVEQQTAGYRTKITKTNAQNGNAHHEKHDKQLFLLLSKICTYRETYYTSHTALHGSTISYFCSFHVNIPTP